MKDLVLLAIDTAKAKGASYADARVVQYRRQYIACEDQRVSQLVDSEDWGIGVRVIADGAWGFAGSSLLTPEDVQRATAEAVAISKASASARSKPVQLAPEPVHHISFRSACEVDPFSVPVDTKVGLLLQINAALLKHAGIKKATSYMLFKREERVFASTEGSLMDSIIYTTAVSYTATAVGEGDARSRTYAPPPMTKGYENINAADLLSNTERVAQQAIEHLKAPEVDDMVTDLVLDPLNLALTLHESVGHPTELDRALGYEESLAGRSFATPDKLHRLQYGSPIVNFVADNTLPGGLATQGFDDDGVECQRWYVVKDGIFCGYSTSREVAAEIGMPRSTGSTRADSWGSIPIVRQPNLSLMPGKEPLSPEELIADTKDGIYIEGMGSFSIDQMRQNFQFGGDAFWRIKHGKLVHMLKNVTYHSITEKFWNSCDAICDERFWVPNGVLNCGKGDPMQIAQMTHGAATARFRQVQVRRAR
jgi:TldD protein